MGAPQILRVSEALALQQKINGNTRYGDIEPDRQEHAICEKPLALNLPDAMAIVEACRAADVHLFYAASYRFLPAISRARELIRNGAIGTVRLLVETLVGGRGPAHHAAMSAAHFPVGGPGGGGWGLVDHGIHLIDVFPNGR